MTKHCFKCYEEKPISSFYRHPKMKDGRLNKCKECTKSDVKANRKSNRGHYESYEKERFHRPERKAQIRKYACSEKGKAAKAKAHKKYKEAYPDRYLARTAVNNAVRDGRLEKLPCEVCGSENRVHGHHEDYSKPLDVVWLCPAHHAERHPRASDG